MALTRPELSIVVPCYNEGEALPLLRKRLVDVLDTLTSTWEVLLVDDGSTDETLFASEQIYEGDSRFKVIALSRNFGHQAAIAAGLSYAAGAAVAVMDADLQDPPEVLGECVARWREGYEVVFAIREKRKEPLLLRAAYRLFYRTLRAVADVAMPLDAGDFCLMDRRVVDVLRRMPERNIFVRGLRAWTGFRQIGVVYERDRRAAGTTKYPLRKLVRLALDGIFAFTTFPLRLATFAGVAVVALDAMAIAVVVIWRAFGLEFMGHTARDIPGWAGVVVAVLFLGGVQLVVLGILGEYIARIYGEVKRRPRWIVRRTLGIRRHPRRTE